MSHVKQQCDSQSVHREAKAISFLCPTVEAAGENFYSGQEKKKPLKSSASCAERKHPAFSSPVFVFPF